MKLIMSRDEFAAMRNVIINLNNPEITEIWNQIISPEHTQADNSSVYTDIQEKDAIVFLTILGKHSKPIGNLLRKGIKITDIGELKHIFTALGDSLKRSFKNW